MCLFFVLSDVLKKDMSFLNFKSTGSAIHCFQWVAKDILTLTIWFPLITINDFTVQEFGHFIGKSPWVFNKTHFIEFVLNLFYNSDAVSKKIVYFCPFLLFHLCAFLLFWVTTDLVSSQLHENLKPLISSVMNWNIYSRLLVALIWLQLLVRCFWERVTLRFLAVK